MNARDFLTLAQNLAIAGNEAAWRSAASRAYDAAFHVARELLEGLRFVVPRAERGHAYLWLRLSNCGDAHVQLAGRELNDLRGERNRADYDVTRSFLQAAARGHVRVAQRIIQILDSATVEPTWTAITDAMKVYERDVLKEVTWRP